MKSSILITLHDLLTNTSFAFFTIIATGFESEVSSTYRMTLLITALTCLTLSVIVHYKYERNINQGLN